MRCRSGWRPLLLIVAVVSIPLAGIGFVYTVAGTDVVFEQEKQSGVWQQGFLGMGVGTTELVPFWKINEIRIEEITRERQRGQLQDLAQLEIILVKESGKRLRVGDIIVARSMVARRPRRRPRGRRRDRRHDRQAARSRPPSSAAPGTTAEPQSKTPIEATEDAEEAVDA